MRTSTTLGLLAAIGLLASESSAQTLITVDPGSGAVAFELNANASAFCLAPLPLPFVQRDFPLAPGLCPLPGPLAPPFEGTAYDAMSNGLLVSDGTLLAEYNATNGGFRRSWMFAGPSAGLGFDSAGRVLWTTNGTNEVQAYALPTGGACGLGIAPFASFTLPAGSPPPTAIDWDPLGGFLWVGFVDGSVQDFLPAGGPGPLGGVRKAVTGLACTTAGAPIDALTVDRGSPVPGHLFVSDTAHVIAVDANPAVPLPYASFAFSLPCFSPGPPVHGLTHVAHGARYGGSSPALGPIARSIGSSALGSSSLQQNVDNAPAGGLAFPYLSLGPACPPIAVGGVDLFIDPGLAILLGAGPLPVPGSGTATLATPVPFGLPPGFEFFVQWVTISPLGAVGGSDALVYRATLP
ncbi:MAG: hypothetical protein AAFZ65_03990 [Planctomycetota bacterium]